MTITTKVTELPTTRKTVVIVGAAVAVLLMTVGAMALVDGATADLGGEDVLATADSDARPTERVAAIEPVGAGRSIPGPDGWMTYTDPTQSWQLDVPSPLHEVNGGVGVTALVALDGAVSYGVEWTAPTGAIDLLVVAEELMRYVHADLEFELETPIDDLGSTLEAVNVGELSAVRYSADLELDGEFLRHSGLVFESGGELVNAFVLDFGGASPLDADRYLSSVRALT